MTTRNQRIVADTTAVLASGMQGGNQLVHANAGSNAAAGTIPAYATTLWTYSTVPHRVAVGEATDGTLVGIPLAPNMTHRLGVTPSGGTLNMQTIGTAGTIHYGYTGGDL
jgi:hypothetical protein